MDVRKTTLREGVEQREAELGSVSHCIPTNEALLGGGGVQLSLIPITLGVFIPYL